MRNILIATTFLIGFGFAADAQPKKAAPAAGKHEVLESTKTTTSFRGSKATSDEYRFTIVWKDQAPPATEFFFKDGNEWKEIRIARPERRQFSSNPQDYMMVENTIQPKDVRFGDKIVLTTERHSHDEEEMPAVVKGMAKQGLFYASGSGKSLTWKLIPVKIRVLPGRVQ